MSARPDGPDAEHARALLDNLPDLLVIADRNARIRWVGAVPESLGWDADDLIDRPIYDVFAKQANHDLHRGAFAAVLETPGTHGPLAMTVIDSRGRLREVEAMATNALDVDAVGAIVIVGRDITVRGGTVETLRQTQAWSTSLLSGSTDLTLASDRFGRIAYVGPSVTRILGLQGDDVVGSTIASLVHPDDRLIEPHGEHPVDQVLGTSAGRRPLLRFGHADGSWRTLRVERTVTEPASERSMLFTCRDVTRESERADLLTEQSMVLERIARGSPVSETVAGIDHLVDRLVPGYRLMVTYVDPDLGFTCHAPGLDDDLVVSLARTELARTDSSHQDGDGLFRRRAAWDAEVAEVTAGRYTAVWISDRPHQTLTADVRLAILAEHDASLTDEAQSLLSRASDLVVIAVERHDMQARMAHAATHDEVTGLPNRRQLLARLGDTYDNDDATGGLLYIDLDRVKLINDSLGHDAGDQLLRDAARRFTACVRPADLVARVGGDEFVVHCPGLESIDAVAEVAERIIAAFEEPVDLPGGRVVASASIGVVHQTGRADPDTILQNADLALYEAKQSGGNRVALFHPDLRVRARARLDVENDLREALGSDELELHFQPVVRLSDGAMVGVEALVRWDRPGIGVMEPESFIPVATETGLILTIGRWVIEQAVAAVARWPELYVAANLSARQLADADLVEFVRDTLSRYDVDARRLCMEMTETDLIADTEQVMKQLTGFRNLGVRLAIDDFGTGFATLDYLRRFAAADILKIDGSFVAGVADPSSHDMAIVSAALVLADNLGFETIAEGVETEAQSDVLASLGCGYAQGYLYSRPVPAGEIDRIRLIQT